MSPRGLHVVGAGATEDAICGAHCILHTCRLPCRLVHIEICLPGWSPNRRTKGSTIPREVSTAASALRILDAATIFMAFVIFPMFLIARMRSLTAHSKKAVEQRRMHTGNNGL